MQRYGSAPRWTFRREKITVHRRSPPRREDFRSGSEIPSARSNCARGTLQQHTAVDLLRELLRAGGNDVGRDVLLRREAATSGIEVVFALRKMRRMRRSLWGSDTVTSAPPGKTRWRGGGLGCGEDRGNGPSSATSPSSKNGDMVAHALDHAHLVRDDDDRDAELLVYVAYQFKDLTRRFGVEGAGRFVAQQTLGVRSPARGQWRCAAADRRRAARDRRLPCRADRPSPEAPARFEPPRPFLTPASSIGKQIFFRQFRCMSRLKRWKIMVMLRLRARKLRGRHCVKLSPFTIISPLRWAFRAGLCIARACSCLRRTCLLFRICLRRLW